MSGGRNGSRAVCLGGGSRARQAAAGYRARVQIRSPPRLRATALQFGEGEARDARYWIVLLRRAARRHVA
ncbi:hypothetical protein WG70_08715 [Burkholderia oklahomensis EO147]|nr:hypothetical protein WG70_08715 [Burkholderia oklahomensis EO147]